MKATTREDLNLKEDETMCERCVHEDICRREQCGEPYCVIRSCFDFEEKRPHGEWTKRSDGFYKCPFCCYSDRSRSNFCPNCGADMREEGEEDAKDPDNR